MVTRRKLLIDTDAGLDDAQAILMALSSPDVDVMGITCVGGNADAKQVGKNVLRILQVADRMDIPVFVGSDASLLGDKKRSDVYHGSDGFGDVPDPNAPDASHLRTEHAVNVLVRMSKEHQGIFLRSERIQWVSRVAVILTEHDNESGNTQHAKARQNKTHGKTKNDCTLLISIEEGLLCDYSQLFISPGSSSSSIAECPGTVQLIRIFIWQRGDLTLVCIGPLTNIALAIRMDPQIGSRLKHCCIMGGNYQGRGNVTVSAEFNFYYDPEAAYVVLNQLGTPITLVPWELCDTNTLSWEWYEMFVKSESRAAVFISRLEKNVIKNFYQPFIDKGIDLGYQVVDQIAMAAVFADDVITDRKHVFATVELQSSCRGQMVVDWNNILRKEANINLVTTVNMEKMKELVVFAINFFGSQT